MENYRERLESKRAEFQRFRSAQWLRVFEYLESSEKWIHVGPEEKEWRNVRQINLEPILCGRQVSHQHWGNEKNNDKETVRNQWGRKRNMTFNILKMRRLSSFEMFSDLCFGYRCPGLLKRAKRANQAVGLPYCLIIAPFFDVNPNITCSAWRRDRHLRGSQLLLPSRVFPFALAVF